MNRRVLSLRAKLIVLVAVPLAALLVVTASAAIDRFGQVRAARTVERDAHAALDATAIVAQLQRERAITSLAFAEGGLGGPGADTLNAQRAATDEVLAVFGSALGRLGKANRSTFDVSRSRLDGLAATRASIDSGALSAWDAFGWYNQTIEAVLTAAGQVTSGLDVSGDAARETVGVDALGRLGESLALEQSLLAGAFRRGHLAGDEYSMYLSLRTRQDVWRTNFDNASMSPAAAATVDALLDSGPTGVVNDGRRQAAAAGFGGTVAMDPQQWSTDMAAIVDGIDAARTAVIADIVANAASVRRDAEAARALYVLASLFSLTLMAGVVMLVGRWVRRPLQALTAAAMDVANHRLPEAVAAASAAGGKPVELARVELATGDELGQLADAFNDMQATAVNLAAEQGAMRRNVAELFANLGRRNQKLITRQLAFIDRLEKREQDPEILENLFRLDHLATRMRRNAESLLVLAGTESPRTWSAPVNLGDTVRAAVAEVEQYERVDIGQLSSGQVRGNVSSNVSHLLAELIENGLNFSPPESTVSVTGRGTADGYTINIVDNGIGIDAAERAELNARLATTTADDLAPTKYLGLFVVARLANRYGITVVLAEGDSGGTNVRVDLPLDLLVDVAGAPERPSANTAPTAAAKPSAQPKDSARPARTEPSARATQPAQPDAPDAAVTPVAKPTAAAPASGPAAAQPSKSGPGSRASKLSRPAKPVQTAQPAPATQPVHTARPVQTAQTAQTAQAAQAAQSAQAAQAAQPRQPAQSAPAKPSQPATPAATDTVAQAGASQTAAEPLAGAARGDVAGGAGPLPSRPAARNDGEVSKGGLKARPARDKRPAGKAGPPPPRPQPAARPAPAPRPASNEPAAPIGGVTDAGLRRRAPKATLDATTASAAGGPQQPRSAAPEGRSAAPVKRDATEVKNMLSQFRAGVTRAQSSDERSSAPAEKPEKPENREVTG